MAQCKYSCYMCMPTCFFCSMIISMFGDRKLNNLHRCKLANIFDMVMVRMQHILQQKHLSGSLIRSTYQGRQKLLNPRVTGCPNTWCSGILHTGGAVGVGEGHHTFIYTTKTELHRLPQKHWMIPKGLCLQVCLSRRQKPPLGQKPPSDSKG